MYAISCAQNYIIVTCDRTIFSFTLGVHFPAIDHIQLRAYLPGTACH